MQEKDALSAELQKGDSHSNVLVEFGRSAFYSGVVNPVRSVAQIADQFGKTHILEDTVKTATENLGIKAPKADTFGTSTWYAQQLGDAVGMMVDNMALRRVTNFAAGKALEGSGQETIEGLHANAMSSGFGSASMMKFARAEAGLSATSGYLYGSLLVPSDEQHVGTTNFWSDRNRQGLGTGATFGITGGMNPYMGRALGRAAAALEKTSVTFAASSDTVVSAAGTAQALSLADTAINTARKGLTASLRVPVLPGVITGVPIGAINAEVSAMQDGHLLPKTEDLKEQIVSMMFVGGAIGGGNWLAATRIGTRNTNLSYIPDGVHSAGRSIGAGVGTAASIGVDKVNLALARGVPIERYKNYYGDNVALLPNLQEHKGYRVQVDETVQSPNINHKTKMISLPATAGSAYRMLPLADISLAAHELGHGAPPAAEAERAIQAADQQGPNASLKPLSESAYVDWRVSRELAAREHERQALIALGRNDEAARIITERDAILGQKISPSGITYAAHFAQDFRRSHGRTDYPTVEHHENEGYATANASPDLGVKQADDPRAAIRFDLVSALSNRRSDEAESLIELKLLTADDLKTNQIREAAQQGLVKHLSEGRIDVAKRVIDLNLLTTDEIREAPQHVLADFLSNGWIHEAKSLIDVKLLTADDLEANEIREAAQQWLAKCLSEGLIDEANRLIELKLLTADDLKIDQIRAAARQGVAIHLSTGLSEEAKSLIALKLLTADDLKTDKIREAAQQGLAIALSDGWIDDAKDVIDLKLLSQDAIDHCFRESAQAGHVTSVLRAALSNGTDLNTALDRYLGISELTDENASKLFADLKSHDTSWSDETNIQRPFKEGATIFGAARMLRYVFKANATPHDALFAFHHIAQLYERSGLSQDNFYNNVLRQVNRDDAVNDTGSSFSRLNTIAQGFPNNIDTVLEKTKNYPDIESLQKLAAAFPDTQSVFASWPNLQRFAKLQQFLDRAELLPKLQQLRQDKKGGLADWVEALAFHPDSKVATTAILDFWQNPQSFLDYREVHSPEAHEQKKPSHYTDIPHLDLSAMQLRDSLVDGTLDRLQVFSPMQVEYEVAGPSIASELKRALGSREASQRGQAKDARKLFSEINKLLKPANFSPSQIQAGVELPAELRQSLEAVLYNKQFGVARPPSGLRFVAQIHRKSDPLAVVAGDDTASCMGFGTGKNNVYTFNPNDALFTVRLVRHDGTSRTIAQSVLTKDKDVKVLFPTILEQMQGNDEKATLHTIFPEEALHSEKTVIAADNVQVHPNYQAGAYPAALESVYRDFFRRYVELHGNDENLRDDKVVIGLGYSDAMNSLPKEPNTYVPQAPVGYTDKSDAEVYSLSLKAPPTTPLQVLKVTNSEVQNRIKPQASAVRGVTPLTFEDTLSLAYLEGKVFQDSPSLRQGLHNMENALIAKDINNAAKDRPNLSVKYADTNGKMKGYLLAYEGERNLEGAKQPVVFIGDFTSDGRTAPDGSHVLSFVGGKLLLEFGRLYKEHYLDKGKLTPIFANTRDPTSHNLLMRQIEALSAKVGCRFEMQELGNYQSDSSTMHEMLIIPHRI